MAIDVGSEQIVSLEEAAIKLGISYYTVRKWTREGVHGLVLESIPVGNRKMKTSIQALNRFAAQLRKIKATADKD